MPCAARCGESGGCRRRYCCRRVPSAENTGSPSCENCDRSRYAFMYRTNSGVRGMRRTLFFVLTAPRVPAFVHAFVTFQTCDQVDAYQGAHADPVTGCLDA